VQRLVHMSTDLARQIGMMLEDSQNGISGKVNIFFLYFFFYFFFFFFFPELYFCTY